MTVLCSGCARGKIPVMDSQPHASPARKPRKPGRRSGGPRQKPALRQDPAATARWKVQLELAPAEIALVYRQGLAHGAEVRRHSKQEWRPLVTTPELRAALAKRASQPDLEFSPAEVSALSLNRSHAIGDPALAAWFSAHRPPTSPMAAVVAPPPPPIISGSQLRAETRLELVKARRRESIPDSASKLESSSENPRSAESCFLAWARGQQVLGMPGLRAASGQRSVLA